MQPLKITYREVCNDTKNVYDLLEDKRVFKTV